MEYLIGLLIAALGGIVYFKSKADDAKVKSKLEYTKAKDGELKLREDRLEALELVVDESLAAVKDKAAKDKERRKGLTLKARRDLSRKRFGKKK